jgi:hypothetical protein
MLTLVPLEKDCTMPQEYRLIPVSVTAIQLTPEKFQRAQLWTGGVPVTEIDALDSKKRFVALNIPTILGTIRAGEGDYIFKDPGTGIFKVMSAKEFERQYEPINPHTF